MAGRKAFIRRSASWGFRGFRQLQDVNARRYVHSPRDHFIITLIISQQTWLSWHSGQVASNPNRSWLHRHTSLNHYLASTHDSMYSSIYTSINKIKNNFQVIILNLVRICFLSMIIIFRVIKSRRLRWAGHVARMEEGRSAFKILTVNQQERDLVGGLGVDGRTILGWI